MKKILFLFLWMCACCFSKAQYSELKWGKNVGSAYRESFTDVAVDGTGSVYTVGSFEKEFDVDPGAGIELITPLGSSDLFIMKHDSSGKFLWARTLGSRFSESTAKIAFSAEGYLWLSTPLIDTFFWQSRSSGTRFISGGETDILLLKIDPAGNFVESFQIGGLGKQIPTSIKIDDSLNIFLTGAYTGDVDFDPGPGTAILSSRATQTGYVLKLGKTGSFRWVNQFEARFNAVVNDLTIDRQRNIYLCGIFGDTLDLDPGPGIKKVVSTGSYDMFFEKLSPTGELIWARTCGGTKQDNAARVQVDRKGNLFCSGDFRDYIDIDPGSGVTMLYASAPGNACPFIFQLDSSGKYNWGGQLYNSSIAATTMDTADNFIASGNYVGKLDFDIGPGTRYLEAAGYGDMFLMKLNTKGALLSAEGFGSRTIYVYGGGLAVNQWNDLYFAGSFNGTVNFQGHGKPQFVYTKGNLDGLILKYRQCALLKTHRSLFGCSPYYFNGKTLIYDGTYTEVFSSAGGCDSTVTLDLTLVSLNPVISSYGLYMGISTILDATYQWVECPSYTPIPGETKRLFTATKAGSYAVIVRVGDCVDTAACHNAVPLGLNTLETGEKLHAFPNPSTGIVHLNGLIGEHARFEVLDVFGRICIAQSELDVTQKVDLNEQSPGIYFIRVWDELSGYTTLKVTRL